MEFNLTPLGIIHTDFKQKFGIPRQSGLAQDTRGEIHINAEFSHPDFWREIEGFSHLWLITWLHQQANTEPRPLIRPPRLGGNQKVGVFASRSPFRPNPLGLSLVELLNIQYGKKETILSIKNHDILDGTPVLDIKPYLGDADTAQGEIRLGWTTKQQHKNFSVIFEEEFEQKLKESIPADNERQEFKKVLTQILGHDIRPRYKEDENIYWFQYGPFDIGFYQSADHQFCLCDLKLL